MNESLVDSFVLNLQLQDFSALDVLWWLDFSKQA